MKQKELYVAPATEVLELTLGSTILFGSENVTSGGEDMYDD